MAGPSAAMTIGGPSERQSKHLFRTGPSVENRLVVLPIGLRRMDRHDVELEALRVIDGRGIEALRQDIARRTTKQQREWPRRAGAEDTGKKQYPVPAGEAELLVHMRNEILMTQRIDHADLPAALPDTASLSGDAMRGEGFLFNHGAVNLCIDGGDIILRPERADDADFLAALFRFSALEDLAFMPVDDTVKEALVRMQFDSQTATYRSQFPQARFDIVERDGEPIGRIVIDPGGQVGCIVDFALLPDRQGQGLGTAILRAVLAQFAGLRRRVECKVLAGNEPSLRMCRRVGFVQTDEALPFLQLEWRPPEVS
jgi:RimJ/RimL family protein N-acetyltransferase